jgi:hypothetical protein
MKPWPRRRSEARSLAAFEEAVSSPRRGLLDRLWHSRNELMLLTFVSAASAVLVRTIGSNATIFVAVTVAEVVWAIPATRRAATARLWWLATPHRVRAACAQARIQSRKGRLPVVLRTSLTPHGERVHLWCRAGTTAEDVAAARPLLRAACWATDVRVTRNAKHAHLVTVEVIRHRH